MFKIFCKHKTYKILDCNKGEITYKCQCIKCGELLYFPKARDEMYEIGRIVRKW